MSDKNRVITNGLFRKKMAELLGEDIVNTPQFNDFQALDVSTFTKEVDKLIDNPPWSGGGSDGPIVYKAAVSLSLDGGGDPTFTITSLTYDDPDNGPTAVSLSKALADTNIHVDDSFPYYTLPTQGNIGNVIIDLQVNDTFDGSTIPHIANVSGILRFSAADGITKTVNYSGAIGMPDPGIPGKINTVIMTIIIGDDNGTTTYSFTQTDV